MWVKKGISVHQNLLQKIFSIRSHMQPKTAHFFFISPRCRLFAEHRAYKHHGNECACAYSTSASRLVGCVRHRVSCCRALWKSASVSQRKLNQVLLNCLSTEIQAYVEMLNQIMYLLVWHSFVCALLSRLQSVKISVSTVMSNIFISAWLSKIIINCCWRYVNVWVLKLC